MRTLSSQRYLDPSIVAAKRAAGDYTAHRVEITIDGEELYVVIDGHHSIAAAKADGVDVAWEDEGGEIQHSADAAVEDGTELDWMAERQMDDEWYDIETGRLAW